MLNILRKHGLEIFFGTLFIILLPLAWGINYMQNDEYLYYKIVSQFVSGNYQLHPYLGPTFYGQALPATVFALIFSTDKLPILTLLFSIMGIYIFVKLLVNTFALNKVLATLLALIVLANPLYLYSTFGFMTEIYLMLYFFLTLYFIYKYIKSGNGKDIVLANVFIFLSFMTKQPGLITGVALAMYLISQKRIKYATYTALTTLASYLFYSYVFPQTTQMQNAELAVSNLLNLQRTLSLSFVILIYLCVFLLPLVIVWLVKSSKLLLATPLKNYFKLAVMAAAIVITFLWVSNDFDPGSIKFTSYLEDGRTLVNNAKAEFPYLSNIYGREGFYVENLSIGSKYYYPGFYDLFNFYQILGIVLSIAVIATVIIKPKQFLEFSTIYIICFTLYLNLIPKVFDRYLITLIPVTILLVIEQLKNCSRLTYMFLATFTVFTIYMGYQYTLDFVFLNKYMWNKSLELSKDISKNEINADHSWRKLYNQPDETQTFYFAYKIEDTTVAQTYAVVEKQLIDFPFNFYLEPNIYLLKRAF